jgi:hypothetical protein
MRRFYLVLVLAILIQACAGMPFGGVSVSTNTPAPTAQHYTFTDHCTYPNVGPIPAVGYFYPRSNLYRERHGYSDCDVNSHEARTRVSFRSGF